MALLRRVRPPLPGARCRHRPLSTYGHVYDPHRTLGVRPGCTEHELKAAYRKLALRHHPDRLKPTDDAAVAARLFAQISEAFETLQAQRKGIVSRAGAAAQTQWGEQGHGSARRQHQQAQSAPGSVHPSSLTAPGVAFAGLALGIMFLISRVSASPPAPAARPQRSILEKHEVAPIGWSRRRRAEQKQQEPLTTPAVAAVAATATASVAAARGEEPTSTVAPAVAAAAPPRPLASEAATAELPVPAAAGAAAGAGAATAAATAGVDAGNTAKTAKNKRKVKRAYGNSYLPHSGPGRVRHKQSATSATVACRVMSRLLSHQQDYYVYACRGQNHHTAGRVPPVGRVTN